MKKVIITIICCCMTFSLLTACAKQENSKNEVQNESAFLEKEDVIKIAKEELTEEEKKSITNFKNPVIEEKYFTEEPNIYKYEDTESMVDKQVYKITFYTEEDDLLGPIVFYIDALDGQIYGMDYRE